MLEISMKIYCFTRNSFNIQDFALILMNTYFGHSTYLIIQCNKVFVVTP